MSERVQIGFAEKVALFGLDEKGSRAFPAIARVIRRAGPGALARFYTVIEGNATMRGFFKTPQSMAHARAKQLEHWLQLFSRTPDQAYAERAQKIGVIHGRIGLPPSFYMSGYALVLETVITRMMRGSVFGLFGFGLARRVTTLVKAALLDMDIALGHLIEAQQVERDQVIARLSGALEALAGGDFTAALDDLPPGYEVLSRDFEAMRCRVRDTLTQVADAAHGIKTGSSEMSAASADLAQRTEEQAATLGQTAQSLSEVTGAVRSTARDATNAREFVGAAEADAQEGDRVVTATVATMDRIADFSNRIGQIVGLIDGIAFQTNLLALNAGVEAARAGDAGRGFAVVAAEVRALAQRSAEAASEIKTLITDSRQEVSAGVSQVGATGEVLKRTLSRIAEIGRLVREISASVESQAASLQQIDGAVTGMDQMTQQNAAMVEESDAAARMLASQSEHLAELVGFFDLGEAPAAPATGPVLAVDNPRRVARGRR
ncbi:globin-coupled sensor protein [Sphingomonas sp.]|uniref:globin-coupled sensor protein n=1 Tax=Sphingomonas sp. TaxID=28214 RepID=UPI001D703F5D|nr:globin-coupled sensor protein [Sphingomonas sp.]MBX9795952.1 globin-coupled sensor protein [Sphingomonas sp.]